MRFKALLNLFSLLLLLFIGSCHSGTTSQASYKAQDTSKVIGGGCDGCEVMYEEMPDALQWTDTLPDWNEAGEKMMINGTVFQADGENPAPNVILYFYHTDSKGYYSPSPEQTLGLRHGHIRGWVKTNLHGQYKIFTNMPAPYPGANIPAHIHLIVKEPGKNEYYLDEYEFRNDSLLTSALELKREKRGGSGIVDVIRDSNGILLCRRDIILGLNIPDYN